MGEKRNVYRLFVGKPEGKRPLGRPKCKWVDNFKMVLVEREEGGIDWIDLAQDRYRWRSLVNAVRNLRIVENAGKFLRSCRTSGLSKRAQLQGIRQLFRYADRRFSSF
jgi:hypothetical protein